MQKTVRINLLARNNAAKKFQKNKYLRDHAEWKDWHASTNKSKATRNTYLREERQSRREDWMLGPLAPNRNSGVNRGSFGTVGIETVQIPPVPKSVYAGPKDVGYAAFNEKKIEKEGFKGDTLVGNVVAGDRVVVVAGSERLRGTIGTVTAVDLENEEVKLQDLNIVDVRIPAYNQPPPNPQDPSPAKFTTINAAIPISHVRLVMPTKQDDGTMSDIVIRHVHAGPPYVQRPLGSNLPSHTRYVTLSDETPMALPWPEDNISDDFIHFDGDTTRLQVSDPTWVPGLARSQLGYAAILPNSISIESDAYSRAPELLARDVKGPEDLSNAQRAGLSGFVDEEKLRERQERIAQGIMNEFRTKSKELNTRHDDATWVKRKMVEDARAIWYRERQVVSPTTQARQAEVERKQKEREAKIAEEKNKIQELKELVGQMQGAPGRVKYNPDKKLRKELENLILEGEIRLKNAKAARKTKNVEII